MAHRPDNPASRPTGFAAGRPLSQMVKPDGKGGFMAVAGAGGFATADEAKSWLDKLAELMVDVDATHRPAPGRPS